VTAAVATLEQASKRFGSTVALADVSLEIRAGSVVALLGANGAGKTTALSLLLGLRRPDDGTATLFGADPRRPEARARLVRPTGRRCCAGSCWTSWRHDRPAGSPVASGAGWRWRLPSSARPSCSFSTSPRPASTWSHGRRSGQRCANS